MGPAEVRKGGRDGGTQRHRESGPQKAWVPAGLPPRKAEAPEPSRAGRRLSCDRRALLSATLNPSGDQGLVNTSRLALGPASRLFLKD